MAHATVEMALSEPAAAVGAALLALPEGQWFERKSVRIKPSELAQHLVGMANADGGVLVIGLRQGVVEGIDAEPHRVNELRQTHLDRTAPPVRVTARELPCVNSSGAADHLLVLDVSSGEEVPCDDRRPLLPPCRG